MVASHLKTCLPVSLCMALLISSCKDKEANDYKCYPDDVGEIIFASCAVSGCHNDQSFLAAGRLNLAGWEKLFEGGNHNASVIPYRPDLSVFMYYINTDSSAGPILEPRMPYERAPLEDAQIATIRNWIQQGAPDCTGFVKFSDNPNRPKVYIPNQGCDLMAVIDLETKLIMRYIDVGASQAMIESPHSVRIAPDGKHWYVCFSNDGTLFQKFRTSDDAFVGQAVIGAGSWNTFTITSDSKYAFVVNLAAGGNVAYINLETMTLIDLYGGFSFPHGSALKDDATLYITAQFGNFIYKINISNPDNPVVSTVILQTGETPSTVSQYDAHEIAFSPDNTQYAVTCEKSNDVRFFNAENDSLIAVVPTGTFPQEIAFSAETDYVFVTCTEDKQTFPGNTGSVAVINYKTHTLVKKINSGFQPHGIGVDDVSRQVFVANRNANPDGPPPHHSTDCGGRNGYFTVIDMNTLELVPGYRVELSVDPYFVAIRR